MTKNRSLILFLSLLWLTALACGPLGGDNSKNATDEAPAATEAVVEVVEQPTEPPPGPPTATAVPEPTATAEPTPEPVQPTPVPAEVVEQSNPLAGIAYGIPQGWVAEELFTFNLISSNEANMAALESDVFDFSLIDGALGFILTGTPEEIDVDAPPGSSALDVLNIALGDPDNVDGLLTDPETIEAPAALTINGQDAATATLRGNDDNGQAGYLMMTTVAGPAGRYAIMTVFVTDDAYGSMKADVDAISGSIVLSLPDEGASSGGNGGGIGDVPEGFEIYVYPDGRYSLFYPGDWTVDDSDAEVTYVVSDPAFVDSDEFTEGAGVIIIANDDISALFDFFSPTEIIQLFVGDDSEVFDTIDSTGEITEYESFGQTVTSNTFSGTANGTPVEAIIAVIQSGSDGAIVIAATDDEAAYFPTMQTIIDSIILTGGGGSGSGVEVGEATPILVNQIYEGTWVGTDGDSDFVFPGIGGAPVLIVLVPDEGTDATIDVYDSDGNYVDSVDDAFSGEAEAVYFVPETSGDYVITVGNFFSADGTFALYLFDLQPGSTTVADIQEDALTTDGNSVWTLTGTEDVPVIAYVRPVGSNADDMDLTLVVSDSNGAEVTEADATFLGEGEVVFFVPAADGDYTLTIEDFFGEAGSIEIFLLEALAN